MEELRISFCRASGRFPLKDQGLREKEEAAVRLGSDLLNCLPWHHLTLPTDLSSQGTTECVPTSTCRTETVRWKLPACSEHHPPPVGTYLISSNQAAN